MSDTHYELIGVPPDASREDIRTAYRARVEELQAARDKKGVGDAALAENREAVARLNTAWNVLSDPYQRGRYDERLAEGEVARGDEVELVDDQGSTTQLQGWRKIFAPPPPAKGRSAATSRPQPTTVAGGLRVAEQRSRFRALTFDFLLVALIFAGVQSVVPPLVKSDYHHIVDRVNHLRDQSSKLDDKADAADSRADRAATALAKAKRQGDSAAEDAARSTRDAQRAKAKSFRKEANHDDDVAKKANDTLRTSSLIANLVILVLALLYLVPLTALRGQTFGHRIAKVRVVREDGSPVGVLPCVYRYGMPLLLALAFGVPFGGALALFLVLMGTGKGTHQGMHDKLAHTLVVDV